MLMPCSWFRPVGHFETASLARIRWKEFIAWVLATWNLFVSSFYNCL